jgi:hypothetical protein
VPPRTWFILTALLALLLLAYSLLGREEGVIAPAPPAPPPVTGAPR